MHSMPAQSYKLAVASEFWALDLPLQMRAHPLPDAPLELVVLQPQVAVLECDPQVPRHLVTMSSPEQMVDSVRFPEVAEWQLRLEKKFPLHSVFVAMRRDGGTAPMLLRGEAVTVQGAVAKFSTESVRLADFAGPHKVKLERVGAVGGSVVLTLSNELQPYVGRMNLRLFQTDGPGGFVYLKGDSRNPVPVGKYEFECSGNGIGHLIARQEIDVVQGAEVRLHVAPRAPFRVVKFHTEAPPGRPVPGVEIIAIPDPPDRRAPRASFNGPWAGSCEMLIPAGKYRVRTMTEKFEVLWTDLEIDLASKEQIDVALVLLPKVK